MISDSFGLYERGGHNHEFIGTNIKIRRYLFKQTDDMPFVALISIRYSTRRKTGKWIDKRRKSSMFPMNWVINRVKQEIALVYDEWVKVYGVSKKTEFSLLESTGKFKILIKVDKAGTILNAYPVL